VCCGARVCRGPGGAHKKFDSSPGHGIMRGLAIFMIGFIISIPEKEERNMWKIKSVCAALFLVVLAQPLFALTEQRVLEDRFKRSVNELRTRIREIEDPEEKRQVLARTIRRMIRQLERAGEKASLTPEERAQVASLEQSFRDKYDELEGLNGFQRVPDRELDRFADYVLQDVEQARDYVTISVAALIIIILLIILIL